MKGRIVLCVFSVLFFACKPSHQCPSYSNSGVKSASDVMKHHDKKKGKK